MPIPQGWFYLNLNAPGTRAYFLTPEPLAKTGIFTRGFSVSIYLGFGKRVGQPAVDFPVFFLSNPEETFKPLGITANGALDIIQDEPFVVCKRQLVKPEAKYATVPSVHGELVTKLIPPSNYYYMAAGNTKTETVYMAWFETPSVDWSQDSETAQVMIDSLILDPKI